MSVDPSYEAYQGLLITKTKSFSKSDKSGSSYGHSKFGIFVFVEAERNVSDLNNFDKSELCDIKFV